MGSDTLFSSFIFSVGSFDFSETVKLEALANKYYYGVDCFDFLALYCVTSKVLRNICI